MVQTVYYAVADPGIDRRGGGGVAPIFQKLYTPELALICSRGVRMHSPQGNIEN